ncbi:hypothetical protein [Psychrobacillus psychrotolerans]|uniref:hypothetical protein n=1 Tax=Psychrobacillus psychrotolerans TaxID=126156 RepID=UPI003B022493
MNQQELMTMSEVERVEFINQMLREPSIKRLAEVASKIGMSSSSLGKKMTEGAYTYSRSLKQYILRDDNEGTLNKEEVMKFLQENYGLLKALIEREQKIDSMTVLSLSPEVVKTKGDYIVKNTKIPSEINDQFSRLCEEKFSYLKLQDLLSQALWEFVIKYR